MKVLLPHMVDPLDIHTKDCEHFDLIRCQKGVSLVNCLVRHRYDALGGTRCEQGVNGVLRCHRNLGKKVKALAQGLSIEINGLEHEAHRDLPKIQGTDLAFRRQVDVEAVLRSELSPVDGGGCLAVVSELACELSLEVGLPLRPAPEPPIKKG